MADNNPLSLHYQAMNSAFDRLNEMQDAAEKDPQPIIPMTDEPGKVVAEQPMRRADALAEYETVRNDPVLFASYVAQQSQGLPPDAPFPRRLVESIIEAERHYQQAQKGGE